MIILTNQQKNLLVSILPNYDFLLAQDDVNELLSELDDVLIASGMDKNYDLNELGLTLQVAYDEILFQNE